MSEQEQSAPRVTYSDISEQIVSEHYFTARDGRRGALADGTYVARERPQPNEADLEALDHITICVLILKNGTKLVGVNEGPVSAANFSAELGRQYARKQAIDQAWPLLGYELRSKLTAERGENTTDWSAA